ncbi:hypothetical protein LIG30_0484 [Burkholderia sp. lig30]|jgi:hypothetical protein|uniref:hypothetical protein n=1 Tax=Burkholderia sp. lig30 TaxID=1192124 RepID=UPI000461CABF|nr:hypothetical protein [Burkholderia sp. lig30]KDB06210.1 hypothetical protein LIG30_0484 [Burkholderia sp. lig30]
MNKRMLLLPLLASVALAGCAVYPYPAQPGVGVDVSVGWHGDRYWDGQRYWQRAEWERDHPPRGGDYRRDREDYRGGDHRDGDRRDGNRRDDSRRGDERSY